MRDRLADESAEQREARLQHMREQMRDRLILTLTLNNNISKTTNSACAHQLRLAPQYDMHITSMYMDRERSTRLCSLVCRNANGKRKTPRPISMNMIRPHGT